MLGGERDGGGELQRIVHRELRGLVDGVIVGALVDIVIADDVGDEYAVENAAFQRPRQILPIVQILVFPRLIARMSPQSGGLMRDAIHVERVESNMPCHASSGRIRPAIKLRAAMLLEK